MCAACEGEEVPIFSWILCSCLHGHAQKLGLRGNWSNVRSGAVKIVLTKNSSRLCVISKKKTIEFKEK